MNESSMHQLEWPVMKEMLIEMAVSPAGKAIAATLSPSTDIRRIEAMQTEADEAMKLLATGASVPLTSAEGMDNFFALLGKGVIYTAADLTQLAVWLSAVGQMKRYMASKEAIAPTISAYADTLTDCPELRGELERCLRYGQVTDQASPELAKIRRGLAAAEDAIKRRLEQSLGKYKAYLQDPIVSKRNGHYVVPVRKEHRKHVQGTVWDQSSSGQTLFIEPADIAGLQAEWEMWKADEGREESIVLARLSELAEEHSVELQLNVEAMASFDFLFARAKLGRTYDGRKATMTAEAELKLVEARHPLLGSKAVPLNAEIGRSYRQLIITGPNTGGKTVALKTLGLLPLMAQAGLPVPASEASRFGVLRHVMADVGDGQSLEQSLSTFSAHIAAVKDMLNRADDCSLLLLDELAAGTDPGEGIALSLAILEELLSRGSLVVATTHFNEIKSFARDTEGCQNARMAFNPDTLQPEYRLEIGEAGDSYAFAIARKYGMPEKVVRRAEERQRWRSRQGGSGFGTEDAAHGDEVPGGDQVPALSPYLDATDWRRKKDSMKAALPNKPGSNGAAQTGETEGTEAAAARPLQVGDCVWIYPLKRTGIVYKTSNERGDVVVQVQKQKLTFNRKRLALRIPREQLYPGEDYDLDIVFESVDNRKKRKLMSRKYTKDTVIVTPPEEQYD